MSQRTVQYYVELFDFSKTIKKWLSFKNKFKVFYFDDMVENRENFYSDVCDFLEITPNSCVTRKVNDLQSMTTNTKEIELDFTNYILEINSEITKLEYLLDKDFSQWKR